MRTAYRTAPVAFFLLICAAHVPALETEQIVEQNDGAALVIIGEDHEGKQLVQASGCCVHRSGLVLATAHQLTAEGAVNFHALLKDGSRQVLTVLEVDSAADLALLKTASPVATAVRIGDAESLRSGAALVAITAPENLIFTVAKGIVANPKRTYHDRPVLQTDLPFSAGSSGGPVFSESGALIGIVFGKVDLDGQLVTLVTPINAAYALLARHRIPLPSKGSIRAPELEVIPTRGLATSRLPAVQIYNQGVVAINPPDKIQHYLEAVRLFPEFYEAWFNLGTIYTAESNWDKAIEAYQNAGALHPEAVEPLRNLGRVFLKVKRVEEAAGCFERAAALAATDARSFNDLGEAYRQQGRYAEAESAFLKALALKEDYAAAQYNLGLTYVALERVDLAASRFEHYLALSPDAEDAEQVRTWIAQLQKKEGLKTP